MPASMRPSRSIADRIRSQASGTMLRNERRGTGLSQMRSSCAASCTKGAMTPPRGPALQETQIGWVSEHRCTQCGEIIEAAILGARTEKADQMPQHPLFADHHPQRFAGRNRCHPCGDAKIDKAKILKGADSKAAPQPFGIADPQPLASGQRKTLITAAQRFLQTGARNMNVSKMAGSSFDLSARLCFADLLGYKFTIRTKPKKMIRRRAHAKIVTELLLPQREKSSTQLDLQNIFAYQKKSDRRSASVIFFASNARRESGSAKARQQIGNHGIFGKPCVFADKHVKLTRALRQRRRALVALTKFAQLLLDSLEAFLTRALARFALHHAVLVRTDPFIEFRASPTPGKIVKRCIAGVSAAQRPALLVQMQKRLTDRVSKALGRFKPAWLLAKQVVEIARGEEFVTVGGPMLAGPVKIGLQFPSSSPQHLERSRAVPPEPRH